MYVNIIRRKNNNKNTTIVAMSQIFNFYRTLNFREALRCS